MKKREKERQTLELIWDPGSAQVDFGEADFIYRGNKERLKYLVVPFPYSNDSYTQIFRGENAECVCEGLLMASENSHQQSAENNQLQSIEYRQ